MISLIGMSVPNAITSGTGAAQQHSTISRPMPCVFPLHGGQHHPRLPLPDRPDQRLAHQTVDQLGVDALMDLYLAAAAMLLPTIRVAGASTFMNERAQNGLPAALQPVSAAPVDHLSEKPDQLLAIHAQLCRCIIDLELRRSSAISLSRTFALLLQMANGDQLVQLLVE